MKDMKSIKGSGGFRDCKIFLVRQGNAILCRENFYASFTILRLEQNHFLTRAGFTLLTTRWETEPPDGTFPPPETTNLPHTL